VARAPENQGVLMKASRVAALGLVAGAGIWIASGHFMPHEGAQSRAAIRAGEGEAKKPFRVAVADTWVVPHSRKLVLSGRTEADRKVVVTARTGGILTELRVRRGAWVDKGDIMAVLSDEAREAQVLQARAVVTHKRTELEAKRQLILSGTLPKLQLVDLEAQLKVAEASLAAAEAERDRGVVRAPWAGVVHELAVEVGQAAFSFAGREIAQIVALDPMLAVVEVSERKLAGIRVGDPAEVRLVTGETVGGRIRFVAKTATLTTRTYRVEIEMPNADAKIPDGITAEVALPLAPVMATRIPRSALTFSSAGEIGVRIVGADETVGFVPVNVVEDEQTFMWVGGISERSRVIVQGQDFVREGQQVEAVIASADTAARR
jgi:membrane fusion protein, multidrug efflux system